MTIAARAQVANPALQPLAVLVGEWTVTGSHPMLPGRALRGRASFEWIEGGAFLLERSEMEDREVPSGLAIYGSDDAAGTLFMGYFDERGVSRRYDVTIAGRVMSWHRDDPRFRQRMSFTISEDGQRIDSRGEMSRDGGPWEGDLSLSFIRV